MGRNEKKSEQSKSYSEIITVNAFERNIDEFELDNGKEMSERISFLLNIKSSILATFKVK
ncbi:MAG: hypothetical protein IPK55_13610 [Streptococcus sp.]|nr:hypothetical protein [Streptococcus sp.]